MKSRNLVVLMVLLVGCLVAYVGINLYLEPENRITYYCIAFGALGAAIVPTVYFGQEKPQSKRTEQLPPTEHDGNHPLFPMKEISRSNPTHNFEEDNGYSEYDRDFPIVPTRKPLTNDKPFKDRLREATQDKILESVRSGKATINMHVKLEGEDMTMKLAKADSKIKTDTKQPIVQPQQPRKKEKFT